MSKNETGARLRYVRKASSLNQKEVSDALGITQAALSLIERGEVNLSENHAKELERVFGWSASYLLEGFGNPIKEQRAKAPEIISQKYASSIFPYYVTANTNPKNGEEFVEIRASAEFFLPIFPGAEFASGAFSDEMAPTIKRGDIVVCKPVSLESIVPGRVYIIAGPERSVLRRAFPREGSVLLRASNPVFEEFEIKKTDVKKVFEVLGKIEKFANG